MAFNPQDHITKMGNREYLEVKWRLVWYREQYPKGRIETEPFTVGDMVYIKAIVTDNEGNIIASGLATVRDATQREATWAGRVIEKAETAAIGRALAVAGFGTQFTDEDEGEALADSPVERKQAPKASPAPKTPLSTVWNKTEQEQFWSLWNGEKKLVKDSILAALNVSKLSDFKGTLADANAAMETYIKKVG